MTLSFGTSRGLALFALLVLTESCAAHSTTRYVATATKDVTGGAALVAAPSGVAPGAALVAAPSDCELRLFIEQRPGGGWYGVPAKSLGVAAVERVGTEAPAQLRDGICIKRPGAEINLPAGILVASENGDGLERYCGAGSESGAVGKDAVQFCSWNGVMHASRPFTFTLVSAPDTSVGDLVEFARIYRNGDLLAAWNRSGDQKVKNQVVLGGEGLRSHFFSPSQPPHLADLDIRIIPRDAAITEAVDTTVRDDLKAFETRASNALKAAADEALPPNSPARQSLDCLKLTVVHAEEQILETIHGKAQVPQLAGGCQLPLTATAGTPLKDAYEKAENQARGRLLQLKDDAQARLEKARQELEAKLPPAATTALENGAKSLYDKADAKVQKAVADYLSKQNQDAKNPSQLLALLKNERAQLGLGGADLINLNDLYSGVSALATDVDTQVKNALATVDEAHALANTLYDQAAQIAANPTRQAQIFNALAQSLKDQGAVFEPRVDNPPLLLNEQKITMQYSDHVQLFSLAPWNGVPVRLGGNAGADLNAAVAVPLIDLIGLRYQWSKNRLADLRGALGIGYTLTNDGSADGSNANEAGALPNASLGIANFKFGLGLVTGKNVGAEFHDRWRFIIGADLYKLISGNNIEAF